jgi:hypothetical protein
MRENEEEETGGGSINVSRRKQNLVNERECNVGNIKNLDGFN